MKSDAIKFVPQYTETSCWVVRAERGDVFALDGSYSSEVIAGPFRTRREAVRTASCK